LGHRPSASRDQHRFAAESDATEELRKTVLRDCDVDRLDSRNCLFDHLGHDDHYGSQGFGAPLVTSQLDGLSFPLCGIRFPFRKVSGPNGGYISGLQRREESGIAVDFAEAHLDIHDDCVH
jgi:hypothetical protein